MTDAEKKSEIVLEGFSRLSQELYRQQDLRGPGTHRNEEFFKWSEAARLLEERIAELEAEVKKLKAEREAVELPEWWKDKIKDWHKILLRLSMSWYRDDNAAEFAPEEEHGADQENPLPSPVDPAPKEDK